MKSAFSQHPKLSKHNLTKQPYSLVNTLRSLVKKSQKHSAVHMVLAMHKC